MFKKYNSIENHYQSKHINRFAERFPSIPDDVYSIEEKLDGSNISIVISNQNVRWAKRSQMIADDDNFNGLQSIKGDYQEVIDMLFTYKEMNDINVIQIFGEIFGQGIQKRINYGDGKYIRFFDIMIDGVFQTPEFLENLFKQNGLEHFLVKRFALIEGLENALNFDCHVVNENGSLIEGVVIKPYKDNYISPVGERFLIKKKNPEFSEREKVTKVKAIKESFRPEVIELSKIFASYVNENRVLSIFSKEGEIDNPKEIGKYIKLVLEDAKEDFLKENELIEMDKKEEKFVYNVGNTIVNILQKYL